MRLSLRSPSYALDQLFEFTARCPRPTRHVVTIEYSGTYACRTNRIDVVPGEVGKLIYLRPLFAVNGHCIWFWLSNMGMR